MFHSLNFSATPIRKAGFSIGILGSALRAVFMLRATRDSLKDSIMGTELDDWNMWW